MPRPAAPWLQRLTPGRFALLLLAYFGTHACLRLLLPDALDLDEAELIYFGQRLRLGYSSQPPLYNWLQYLFFQLFGQSLAALTLLKNLLLFATYFCVYLAGRLLLPGHLAAAAALSLLLLPQIGWESQRDLSHSVVLTTAAALTLYLLLRLPRAPRPATYAALGLAVGLGLLSKYSFALYAAALILAAAASAELRPCLLHRYLAITVLTALAVVAPHAVWLSDHLASAGARTIEKLTAGAAPSWGAGVAAGFGSLTLAGVAFLTPLWLIYAWLFRRARAAAPCPRCRFFAAYFVALAALLALLVLLFGATSFKDRWMQPFLFLVPLAFFVCRPLAADHPGLTRLAWVVGAFALLITLVLALRVPLAPQFGDHFRANLPFDRLAEAIRADGFRQGTIVTSGTHLAGNLRLQFPDCPVEHVGDLEFTLPADSTALLLVARAGEFDALLGALGAPLPAAVRPVRVELAYRYGEGRGERVAFEYAVVTSRFP